MPSPALHTLWQERGLSDQLPAPPTSLKDFVSKILNNLINNLLVSVFLRILLKCSLLLIYVLLHMQSRVEDIDANALRQQNLNKMSISTPSSRPRQNSDERSEVSNRVNYFFPFHST